MHSYSSIHSLQTCNVFLPHHHALVFRTHSFLHFSTIGRHVISTCIMLWPGWLFQGAPCTHTVNCATSTELCKLALNATTFNDLNCNSSSLNCDFLRILYTVPTFVHKKITLMFYTLYFCEWILILVFYYFI